MSTRAILMILCAIALASCGGGGGGGGTSSPTSVSLTTDQVTLKGQAGWLGATSVAVKVDDVPVTVTDGNWSHVITLGSANEKIVQIALIADGVTVAMREVTVSR